MELVYLWVSKYKNIEEQGFNFSPKFKGEFFPKYEIDQENHKILKDNCKLQITSNDNFINIFPENINISAVVGENGSGKSSLSKIIFFLIAHRHYNDPNNRDSSAPARILSDVLIESSEIILVLYDNGFKKITFRNYSINYGKVDDIDFGIKHFPGTVINVDSNVVIEELKHKAIDTFSIHFNYMIDTWFDGIQDDWIKSIYHRTDGYSVPLLLEPYKGHKKQIIDIDNLEFLNTQKILNLYSDITNNKSLTSFFNPEEVKYKLSIVYALNENNEYESMPKLVDKYLKLNILYSVHKGKTRNRIIRCIKSLYDEKKFTKINKLYIVFKTLESDQKYFDKKIFKKIEKQFFEINVCPDLEKLIDINFNKLISDKGTPETAKIEVCIDFLDFKNYKKLNMNYERKISIFENADIFHKIPPWMDLNFYEGTKQLKSLSSGEKMLFMFMVNLLYQVKFIKLSYSKINLFLDEVEFGLHPNWQKRFVKEIIYSLENFDCKFNIYFMSHSPFILSDIPTKNVLFLKGGKQEFPKIDTFGANIHTLLSHGFFMEGLMGEFAKNKIRIIYIAHKYIIHRNIRNRLFSNKHKKSRRFIRIQMKNFWYIQSIIGENFLRAIIKNQLYEIEEILYGKKESIDKEIARLQQQKKSLNG